MPPRSPPFLTRSFLATFLKLAISASINSADNTAANSDNSAANSDSLGYVSVCNLSVDGKYVEDKGITCVCCSNHWRVDDEIMDLKFRSTARWCRIREYSAVTNISYDSWVEGADSRDLFRDFFQNNNNNKVNRHSLSKVLSLRQL